MTATEERRVKLARTVRVTPAAECTCRWARPLHSDPELHDRLLGIESLSPVQAAELVAIIIANDDAGTGAERPLIGDPAEFPQFVMAHNWRDPVAMESLANYVTLAMEEAQQGRISKVAEIEAFATSGVDEDGNRWMTHGGPEHLTVLWREAVHAFEQLPFGEVPTAEQALEARSYLRIVICGLESAAGITEPDYYDPDKA
jgi:hypothetical protein